MSTKNQAISSRMYIVEEKAKNDRNNNHNRYARRGLRLDTPEMLQLLDHPRKYFGEPFCNVHNTGELQAATKYYFILAAAVNWHGFADHPFPLNIKFQASLRRFCERVKAEMLGGDPMSLSEDEGPAHRPPGGLSSILGERTSFRGRHHTYRPVKPTEPTLMPEQQEVDDEGERLFIGEQPKTVQIPKAYRRGPFVSDSSDTEDDDSDSMAFSVPAEKPRIVRHSLSTPTDRSGKPTNPLNKRQLDLASRNTEINTLKRVTTGRITKTHNAATKLKLKLKAQKLLQQAQASITEAFKLIEQGRESMKLNQGEGVLSDNQLTDLQTASDSRCPDDKMIVNTTSDVHNSSEPMQVESQAAQTQNMRRPGRVSRWAL
ncbi:hypothetical protein CC86DRAFT_149159 [Ophiobolus disseminans]|uniref:Uncharacterized protein n=1 Tax=Ophiobolus disseminans TaxID=1469910 RepID=A0A6A6ZDP7_9PLEO|nr:hypothetical protein CC86DRAFT_149159 [Ophiobolus disseminans]